MADILQEIVGENRDTLLEVQRRVNELKAKKVQELQDRLDASLAEVKALQEERLTLVKMPVQKKEFLKTAKKRLREMRSEALEGILMDHLAQSQEQNTVPLQSSSIKLTVMADKNLWRLFFISLTDKDLEILVDKLPNIGISAKDRESRLAEIDKRILKLSSALEVELKGAPVETTK